MFTAALWCSAWPARCFSGNWPPSSTSCCSGIELKSVMGASRALEELAKLMPSDAHKLMPDGSVKDVPLGELAVNDPVLVKPGEKLAADRSEERRVGKECGSRW